MAALLAGALLFASPAYAQESLPVTIAPQSIPAAQSAPALVLARLATDPQTPEAYSAHVELHVKLRTFPYIGLTVHGMSTYRKPGVYHYQLENVPRIAGKFSDLRYDLGDPQSWGTRYDIALAPQSSDAAPVLRLTPKKPVLVAYLDIETDAKHGRMLKVTWKRHDGGTIVLTQTYATLGGAEVVTQQYATIDIPHMRAELTAKYSDVTLDTPTFATVNDR